MIIYVADFFWFFFVFCLQKTPILQKSFAKNKKQKIWKPYYVPIYYAIIVKIPSSYTKSYTLR